MRARFTVSTPPRIRSVADAFALSKADMDTLVDAADVQFTRNEKRLFSTEGSSGGDKWPPLKRPRSPKKYRRKKIMQRTGVLRKSLVNRNDPLHVAFGVLKPRAAITLGTNDTKAAYHIDASPLKNPNLPQRDTLQQTERQENRYLKIYADYFREVKLPQIARLLQASRRVRGAL
jgi:hypothetical protein